MKKSAANVVIPSNAKPPPEEHEVSAAWILARHYSCVITFLPKLEGYKLKSPDFSMHSLVWELKSPVGNSKTTISNNMIIAKQQSHNIVFDARRTKIADDKVEKELTKMLTVKRSISKIILITKDEKVLAIEQ
jgi:hypothetical protein